MGFPGGSDSKESACNAADPGSIPGPRRCRGVGNGNSLQYSCLENPMDRGGWIAKSPQDRKEWNHLKRLSTQMPIQPNTYLVK